MDEMLPSPQLHYLEEIMPQHRLRIATSGMLAQLAAVRSGLGVGVLAHYLAAGTGLVPLLPKEAVWKRTFWLVTHADWYRLRRVRAIWDFMRTAVEAESAFFLAKTVRQTSATGRPGTDPPRLASRLPVEVRRRRR
jgi:DNA-binding transcriptional LysR family regulator